MSPPALRRLLAVAILLVLSALGPPSRAQSGFLPTPTGPVQAGPSLVVDVASGEVLHQRDAAAPWYPASLTKMMTLYLLFEDLKAGKIQLGDQLAFSPYAFNQQPSKLVLPAGATITSPMCSTSSGRPRSVIGIQASALNAIGRPLSRS